MSKIVRYQGDVRAFASDAQGMERTVFGGTNQADDLTSQITASFLRGWGIVGASEHPSLEDFNAAMYAMSQFIAYQHQMGVPEWHAEQEYHIGSICTHNGESYQSLQNANIGSQPPSAKWTPVLTSKNGLANLGLGASAFGLKNFVVFSTAGVSTWTVPDELKSGRKAKVTVIGAGGSGGRSSSGGGGGGGGKAVKLVDLTGIESVPITVGAGGVKPAAGSTSITGNSGGSSSFGTFCSATGGGGGSNVSGGSSGIGVNGDINTGTGPGNPGAYHSSDSYVSGSGGGAGGSGSLSSSNRDGFDAIGPGGGGSGAATGSTTVSCRPGAGYSGMVLIEW